MQAITNSLETKALETSASSSQTAAVLFKLLDASASLPSAHGACLTLAERLCHQSSDQLRSAVSTSDMPAARSALQTLRLIHPALLTETPDVHSLVCDILPGIILQQPELSGSASAFLQRYISGVNTSADSSAQAWTSLCAVLPAAEPAVFDTLLASLMANASDLPSELPNAHLDDTIRKRFESRFVDATSLVDETEVQVIAGLLEHPGKLRSYSSTVYLSV